MKMELSPMQLLAMSCMECGQLLSRPAACATDKEVVEVGVACGAVDPWAVQHVGSCPKCGQSIVAERAVTLTCVCGHGLHRHRKQRRQTPCVERRCVCLKYRPKEGV